MIYAKYSAEVCNFFVHNIMLMYPKTAGDSIKNKERKEKKKSRLVPITKLCREVASKHTPT